MKKLTDALKMKELMETTKQEVCLVLPCTRRMYHDMQINSAKAYILFATKGDDDLQHKLLKSQEFWAWWKNNWTMRDITWLEDNQIMCITQSGKINITTRDNAYNNYLVLHNAHKLSSNLEEYGQRLKQSFTQLLNLIK